MRAALDRRTFLASAAATLWTAACARPTPRRAQAHSAGVTEFQVTTMQTPAVTQDSTASCATRFADRTAAAAEWFQPVLMAFNDAHPGLRAMYTPAFIHAQSDPAGGCDTSGNPAVSAWIGGRYPHGGGADLAPSLRRASFNAEALLPGLVQAVTNKDGHVVGLPVDFSVTALHYDAQALTQARIPLPPDTGWTSGEFFAAVGTLAATQDRLRAFGLDLAVPGGWGAFWAFGDGYGGNVFNGGSASLSAGPVLEGLNAYADILRQTWVGMQAHLAPNPALGFTGVGWSVEGKPWSSRGYTRFPRLPVRAGVPATLEVAYVPGRAPEPEAGAQFVMWLVGPDGQKALTALGYPPVRQDGNLAGSWLSRAATGIAPADLLFTPVDIAVLDFATPVSLDYVVAPALSLADPAQRLSVLKVIEQAANANLAGSLSYADAQKQAIVALMAAGITDVPRQMLQQAGMG